MAILDDLLERCDTRQPWASIVAGPPGRSAAGTWIRLRDLARDPPTIDAAIAAATATCNGASDAGAAYLAGWVGDLVAAKSYGAITAEARAWRIDAGTMWLHRRAEGWYDGLAVGPTDVRVVRGDELAGSPGVVAHSHAVELRQALAADVVAAVQPVFSAIRERAPFGVRGMWGMLVDALASSAGVHALRDARERDAVAAALTFADDLVTAGAPPMTRPTMFPVACRQRDVHAVRKGTCCLWYKVGGPDAGDCAYCLACPLAEAPPRSERWQEWLELELDGPRRD